MNEEYGIWNNVRISVQFRELNLIYVRLSIDIIKRNFHGFIKS